MRELRRGVRLAIRVKRVVEVELDMGSEIVAVGLGTGVGVAVGVVDSVTLAVVGNDWLHGRR